jgi:hypothetical protein
VHIPDQNRMTHQILSRWKHFKDLKQTFAVSHRAEQLCQRVEQRVVDTIEDSVLRPEIMMENLESEEVDDSRRVL